MSPIAGDGVRRDGKDRRAAWAADTGGDERFEGTQTLDGFFSEGCGTSEGEWVASRLAAHSSADRAATPLRKFEESGSKTVSSKCARLP